MNETNKIAGIYVRVSTEEQSRESFVSLKDILSIKFIKMQG